MQRGILGEILPIRFFKIYFPGIKSSQNQSAIVQLSLWKISCRSVAPFWSESRKNKQTNTFSRLILVLIKCMCRLCDLKVGIQVLATLHAEAIFEYQSPEPQWSSSGVLRCRKRCTTLKLYNNFETF